MKVKNHKLGTKKHVCNMDNYDILCNKMKFMFWKSYNSLNKKLADGVVGIIKTLAS